MATVIIHITDEITSNDPTICLPNEIHLSTMGVLACHADSGDTHYQDMSAFAEAYQIDEDSIYRSAAWKSPTVVRG